MRDLKKFRDYCQAMADGGHTPECVTSQAEASRRWSYFHMFREWLPKWGPRPSGPPVTCEGSCVSSDQRELWTQMAAEIDEYLAPQPDLFGNVTSEPEAQQETA